MEVTSSNFEDVLPRIHNSLSCCQFCAIDGEFTGLSLSNPRREDVLDDAEQRYAKVRNSAQHFLIMQFGLATFNWSVEEGCYQAQTFNFYIFPHSNGGTDIRFTCQASSFDFLREHGFDFNKFVYSGIPYITLEQLRAEKSTELRVPRHPLVLKQEEDRNFVAQQMENIRCWVESTQPSVPESGLDLGPATLVLEPSNSYLRAALYQQLEHEFGKSEFYVERLQPNGGSRRSSLKLTRATPAVIAAQESEVAAKRQRQMERAVGFAHVMQALASCNKPVVGHNMLLDLAYLHQQFVGPLPPTLNEFREQVKVLFPGGIYDTKYLAALFPKVFPSTSLDDIQTTLARKHIPAEDEVNGKGILHPTSCSGVEDGCAHVLLADLTESITDTRGELTKVGLPRVMHASLFDRYKNVGANKSCSHEAGYDAYMTGTIFIWISKLLEARSSGSSASALGECCLDLQSVQAYMDRVCMMRSDLPYLPLQGPIPIPDRSNLFLLTASDSLPLPSRDEIMLRFSTMDCDITRIVWLDQTKCYVTLKDSSRATSVDQAVLQSGWHVKLTPYLMPG